MKRCERQLYVPPALRSKFNKNCEYNMEYGKDKYANKAEKRRTYSLGNREDCSQRRSANTVPSRMRFENPSSFNPGNLVDESCYYDSSDFEDCCSVPTEAMSDEEIRMGANEDNSFDHRNKQKGKPTKIDHDNEAENYQTDKISTKHECYSDVKYHANQFLNTESDQNKHDPRLFYDTDDSSISSIETAVDDHIRKGRVLTSTPIPDIVEQKVLDAAKYVPEEETGLESTLLGQSEITVRTNKDERDYNFEIYHDPPSIKSQQTDYSEIFGNNYIPPPVPPPAPVFRLPPVHHWPSVVSSSRGIPLLRQVSPLEMSHTSNRLPSQRLLLRPSLQLYSPFPPTSFIPLNSPPMSFVPRYILPPRLQSAPVHAPNPRGILTFTPPTLVPRERFNPQRPPQEASNFLYMHQRNFNPRSLGTNRQVDAFYIPPPVPPPWQMNASQQIRYSNRCENVRSRQPSSISLANKIIYDGRIWPHNLETRR